jgi:hypothetical protein
MRVLATLAAVWILAAAPAGAQTILGYKLDMREKPGVPSTRALKIKAQEVLSPETLGGDPATYGALVQIIVNGATSSSQAIFLPPGERWRRSPRDVNLPAVGWKYRESSWLGYVTPTVLLQWKKSSSGKFVLQAGFSGRRVPLDVTVPNPGTYAGLVVAVPDGGGGVYYCTNFGGAAGGTVQRNDSIYFRIARPTAEGVCPSGTPVCGDDIIDSPFETCDGTNDAACPGLCGANGFACLCPFCGDGAIDPGESCDTNANPGSCTEGCSYSCQCAVCGDDVVQLPAEECEPSDSESCGGTGTCWAVGSPNQCSCPFCGDGAVNAPEEQCEAGDDAACPGLCVTSECTCPVCGNGDVEPGEECDGGGCPEGQCNANCTCSVCGNGVTESPFEDCDGTDDTACPGQCVTEICYCPVCGNNLADPGEQCDGFDDSACPGLCQSNCTCP